jgi:hypothetical protein
VVRVAASDGLALAPRIRSHRRIGTSPTPSAIPIGVTVRDSVGAIKAVIDATT